MKRAAWISACAVLTLALTTFGQDGKKWKPYQFAGNERYEYKTVLADGEEKKETGFILDVRKKGAEDLEVTWSVKSTVKKDQGAEIIAGGWAAGVTPSLLLMNPTFGIFIEQVELKEGEKMSLLGAGVLKVTKKEKVGDRTGFVCELYTKEGDKDVLVWICAVDPALALPIRSVFYEEGKEKHRMDLVSYKKD